MLPKPAALGTDASSQQGAQRLGSCQAKSHLELGAISYEGLLASLLVARMLLGAPGLTTRNKNLLGANMPSRRLLAWRSPCLAWGHWVASACGLPCRCKSAPCAVCPIQGAMSSKSKMVPSTSRWSIPILSEVLWAKMGVWTVRICHERTMVLVCSSTARLVLMIFGQLITRTESVCGSLLESCLLESCPSLPRKWFGKWFGRACE